MVILGYSIVALLTDKTRDSKSKSTCGACYSETTNLKGLLQERPNLPE